MHRIKEKIWIDEWIYGREKKWRNAQVIPRLRRANKTFKAKFHEFIKKVRIKNLRSEGIKVEEKSRIQANKLADH